MQYFVGNFPNHSSFQDLMKAGHVWHSRNPWKKHLVRRAFFSLNYKLLAECDTIDGQEVQYTYMSLDHSMTGYSKGSTIAVSFDMIVSAGFVCFR